MVIGPRVFERAYREVTTAGAENRTRFLREVTAVFRVAPALEIGVRVSAFDGVPLSPIQREVGVGIPEPYQKALPYVGGSALTDSTLKNMTLMSQCAFFRCFGSWASSW